MDRNFYARLKKAMSYEDALTTLGFKPTDHPSGPEIAKAYKSRVMQSHPDLGGSHEQMVSLNVAKDVLDGKQRPTYDRSPEPEPSYGGGSGYTYTRPEPAKKVEVTFDEAKSKAGLPGAVQWVFVTDTQRARNNYDGDESSRSVRAWVLYGKAEDKHVFLAIESSYYSGLAGANDAGYDKWTMRSSEYTSSSAPTPTWIYGNIAKALSTLPTYDGRFNSKVIPVEGMTTLTKESFSKALHGKTTTVKNMLVNNGQISEDDPSVANRKVVVELELQKDSRFGTGEPKPGYYPYPPGTSQWWDGTYHGDYYKLTLIMNSKEFVLNEEDTQKLLGLRLGGKHFLDVIYGRYYYGGEKKVITRMPKGKVLIDGLLKFLKHLPPQAVEMLEKASQQMTK